ncbi:MAG: mechanosensitive ion channel family protein, partial [Muribaculaceae bacterium]|nr:mechanosensitive ion channel family protein [Muribaculaceae bacterium]
MISPQETHAQSVIEKAGQLMRSAFDTEVPDTAAAQFTVDERLKADSLRLLEMSLRLQEMKMNEIMLRTELDNTRNRAQAEDSMKRAASIREIDSLRAVFHGVPVIVEADTLIIIYASMGGRSPIDRAESIAETVEKIGKEQRSRGDSVYTLENEMYIDLMYGDKVIMSVTEQDALWA